MEFTRKKDARGKIQFAGEISPSFHLHSASFPKISPRFASLHFQPLFLPLLFPLFAVGRNDPSDWKTSCPGTPQGSHWHYECHWRRRRMAMFSPQPLLFPLASSFSLYLLLSSSPGMCVYTSRYVRTCVCMRTFIWIRTIFTCVRVSE